MEAQGGVEVVRQEFLTSILGTGQWPLSSAGSFIPCKEPRDPNRRFVGPTAGLEALEKSENKDHDLTIVCLLAQTKEKSWRIFEMPLC